MARQDDQQGFAPAAMNGAPAGAAEPTTIAGVLLTLERALQAQGIDGRRVFSIAGLEGQPLNNPLERISSRAMGRVMDWVVEQTGDALIGLELGRQMRPQTMHALGHSLQASLNLQDFASRLVRSFRLVSSAARLRFVIADSEATLEFDVHRVVPFQAEDALMVFLVDFLRDLSGESCRPSWIELRRPTPADGGARHRAAFGSEVIFGRSMVRICYDSALLELPFVGPSSELAEHNDRIVTEYLAKLDRSDVEARVKALAVAGLPGGRVAKSAVAAQLHMSPRTLQHRLAQHGMTFNGIVDQLRRDLACAYLEDRTRTVGEISYLLGFSDASNFGRAFKRWTGRTPVQHREMRGGANPDARDDGGQLPDGGGDTGM